MTIAAIVGRGFGPSSGPTRIARRGFSSYRDLPDVEPVGFQYTSLSFTAGSSIAAIVKRGYGVGISSMVLRGFAAAGTQPSGFQGPGAVISGDIQLTSTLFAPSGAACSVANDGLIYAIVPQTGRQYVDEGWYDVTNQQFYSPYSASDYLRLYLNNSAPTQTATIGTQYAWTGVAFAGPVFDDFTADGDSDVLSFTGTVPAGLALASVTQNSGTPAERIVTQLTGTPTVAGTSNITITATDIATAAVVLNTFSLVIGTGIVIPDTYDRVVSQVRALLLAAGLTSYQFSAESSGLTADHATRSIPAAAVTVIPGTLVTVFFSGTAVANAFNLTEAAALSALAGFTVIVSYIASSAVAAGRVATQSLAAGSYALLGDLITIEVVQSVGINVPAVIGLDIAPATVIIHGAGFVVEEFAVPGIIPAGTVVYQFPLAGAAALVGSIILLGVAVTGPRQTLGPALLEVRQGQVQISWGAAFDAVGNAVSGYKLAVNGVWDGVVLEVQQAMVTGLLPDTEYHFAISAIQAVGVEFGIAPECVYSYSSANAQKVVIDQTIPPWKVWGLGRT